MDATTDTSGKFVRDLPGGGTQEFVLSKAEVTIGRAPTCDVFLRDAKVSRVHARVECRGDRCDIVDLESANGISINGVAVTRATLASGDVLRVGGATLVFVREEDSAVAGATEITSVDAMETTLHGTSLSVRIADTMSPRVAVHTATGTWEIAIDGDSLTIGRHPDSDVVIDDASVSRHHAVIERAGDAFTLRDLHSGNGTWIRHGRVGAALVHDGDTIEIGPARLVFKRGFVAEDLTLPGSQRAAVDRRPVVVIPGFAGSNLWRGGEQIWPIARMMLMHPELLRVDQPLEARGLVNQVVIVPNLIKQDQYGVLVDYLKESLGYESKKDLLEFAYDFRRDNRESARRLAADIDAWDPRAPITIIAHSMGCLIARYYIERLNGRRRVERAIFLGGPHAGTPYTTASLLKGPNFLPLGLMNARLREVLATFPSWYQILPPDLLADETWLLDEQRPLLRIAREFRAELGDRSSVPSVCVFGYGFKTITGVTMRRGPQGACHDADLVVTSNGDGTIPEANAVMAGAEIHPVRQHHGSLYADNDVRMRLKLELTR